MALSEWGVGFTYDDKVYIMGDIQHTTNTRANTMQNKPKTGDLFDRGTKYDFELVPLKAHRNHQAITILHGQRDPHHVGLVIPYDSLTGGGVAYNGEIKKRVKIWKVQGT